jgi:phosphoglycolate phosphatase
MVSYTLSALSLSPEEALMVGDSEVDVEAARAAGVACAAVAWGYTARGALAEAGPALILGRPGELEEVLDRCQPLIK